MELHPHLAHKIVDLAALDLRLRHWRAVGSRIVFTNGCFDILHPGHVELLARCRDFGDQVIMGLNSDASVRRLKGPNRPINDQDYRATVMAALESIDAVIIFDEDTPLDLITHIRPNVLVKGGDYTISQIVGAEIVMKYGGEIRIVPLLKSYSTTAVIAKSHT